LLARLARLALVALTLGLFPGFGQAGQPFVPSWIRNDSPTKTVAMEIVADFNQVARYAKGNVRTDIIDFNGYWSGNITLIVPTGWSVRIDFINGSQSFRHSLMVTKPYTEAEMPRKLEEQDAIWGAYIAPLEGLHIQDTAQLSFIAQQSGSYFLACPREGHLKSGHWIGLEVKDGLEQAVAVVHEDKFAPEDLPGRP
jgi:hypothetical protein